ncbi:MAG: beta-mannosidase [Fibrobacter sp.]|nr:beta-mannosidase [Fibrobacter sp.]
MFRSSFIALLVLFSLTNAQVRYEAENAIPIHDHAVQIVEDTQASGGAYVQMREGNLNFKVNMDSAGFYTLWLNYAQANDEGGKIQNLTVNGSSTGQISFPYSQNFTNLKAAGKIKLEKGENSIEIINSWGWVDIDYAEITPYEATAFNISPQLVNPNASVEAQQMFNFLLENFQRKTISGVMTNNVMQNDGKYSPETVESQEEFAWIKNASGKLPALMGLDFMHSTGKNSTDEWFQGYHKATLALAEDIYLRGGIPIYCWHWKDPSQTVEAFYSPSSGNTPSVDFNLNKAFVDSNSYTDFDTESAEYQNIISDIDYIASQLKILADKKIPILWRPLHEASGRWFWWGYKGPGAAKALYHLMYDRLTKHHEINNLIWVWTSDEASDALEWYPGHDVVDIIGRDFYFYPREANHSSLVASFENLKDIFDAKKLIALSENGSVPYPDSMQTDGAHWSFFMPWYGDYAMDGWANDNTTEDWAHIMNHDYVITLDQMPGWDNYTVARKTPTPQRLQAKVQGGQLLIDLGQANGVKLKWYSLQGKLLQQNKLNSSNNGFLTLPIPTFAHNLLVLSLQTDSQNLRILVNTSP